jgi:hypothetical protein
MLLAHLLFHAACVRLVYRSLLLASVCRAEDMSDAGKPRPGSGGKEKGGRGSGVKLPLKKSDKNEKKTSKKVKADQPQQKRQKMTKAEKEERAKLVATVISMPAVGPPVMATEVASQPAHAARVEQAADPATASHRALDVSTLTPSATKTIPTPPVTSAPKRARVRIDGRRQLSATDNRERKLSSHADSSLNSFLLCQGEGQLRG